MEPPLIGPALIKELQRLQSEHPYKFPEQAQIISVIVYDSENGHPVHGLKTSEPTTIFLAQLDNGMNIGTVQSINQPKDDDLLKIATRIPVDQWFSVNMDNLGESGM